MLVAIIKKGTGKVPIEEFRKAKTTADALTAFVNAYTVPLNEADYIAHDTGLAEVSKASPGNQWGYDYDTSSLVELTLATELRRAETVQLMESPNGTVWQQTISDTGVPSGWSKVS